jgi:AAA domain-containing protein/HNH endonuclease
MSRAWAGGSTRAWRKTRELVLARDGYRCQIRGPKCTTTATEADHIVTREAGGTDDPANLRAACGPCNRGRTRGGRRPKIACTLVIGPPGAGKTTWALEHARPGDIVVDLDRLAGALTRTPETGNAAGHGYPQHVRDVAIRARGAAIAAIIDTPALAGVRAYVILAVPKTDQLAGYVAAGWHVEVIDPGPEISRARVHGSDRGRRHADAVDAWYTRREALLALLEPVEEWAW